MLKRLSFMKKAGASERLRELGKDILIAALIISALFLSNKSGLLGGMERHPLRELWESIAGEGGGAERSGGGHAAAARPYAIVVTPQESSHCALCWGDERLESAYERFSAVLGEALGSSLSPEAVSREEWRSALSGVGVFFDFYNEQQLSVLASWLGTDISGGAGPNTSRRIVLAMEGESVALYYLRTRDDTPYRCATALSWTAVAERMTDYLPNGALFNFERGRPFESVDDSALILNEIRALPGLTAVNSMPTDKSGSDAILTALGLNLNAALMYPEQDGRVYVEGDAVARLGADGVVRFTGGAGDGAERLPQSDAIERVRLLLNETLGMRAGGAELSLSHIRYSLETEEYTIRFDYRVNGFPVSLKGWGSAAEVSLGGNAITSARLVFRGYYESGAGEQPLSSLQAAAATEAKGGGEPRLCYYDDMNEVWADWLIY